MGYSEESDYKTIKLPYNCWKTSGQQLVWERNWYKMSFVGREGTVAMRVTMGLCSGRALKRNSVLYQRQYNWALQVGYGIPSKPEKSLH